MATTFPGSVQTFGNPTALDPMRATGLEHHTVHATLGDTLEAVQAKLIAEMVSVRDFGAVGDGVTDDTAAIQMALDYAFAAGGAEIFFPPGRYYRPNSSPSLLVRGNVKLSGAGNRISVLVSGDSVISSRSDLLYAIGQAQNVTLESLGFEADWGSGGDYSQRSHLVQLVGDGSGRLEVIGCRFSNSRFMACIGNAFASVLATGNEVYRTEADGLRFTACDNVSVIGNTFIDVNDDSIAIHTKDTEPSPVQGGIVVTGNRIIDSQGIAVLGGKQVNISNNVLNRCIVRGIFVGTSAPNPTEGNTAALGVTISGNVITDMIAGTAFFAGSGGSAHYIFVGALPPTTNGAGYVGQRDGSGGIVSPFPYFYTNDTDAVAPAAGNWILNITGNICARTLDPVSNYSAWGFGTRYGRGGPVDPAISAAQLGSSSGQIIIANHAQGAIIHGNQLWGGGSGIHLDGSSGSAYLSFRDMQISNNKISNFLSYGVYVEGEGVVNIDGNTFDGDPLHTNPLRAANGTWVNSTAHAAIAYTGGRAIITGNTFRNLATVLNGAATDDNSWGGNTFCCDPAVNSGYSASNIGLGSYAAFQRYGAYQLVIEDGDPSSSTYGKVKNICLNGAVAMPTAGKYVQGHVVRSATPTVAGSAPNQYVVSGWLRMTTGTNHVLNTDWVQMRTLTGT